MIDKPSNPCPPNLDLRLIRRAFADRRGTAFARLYHCYAPTVRSAVSYWVNRWPVVKPHLDDIVQEVWLELWRYGQRKEVLGYDPSRGVPFARFLALVAGRLGLKRITQRLRHVADPLDEEPDDEGWDFTLVLADADVRHKLVVAVEAELDEMSHCFFREHFIKGRRIKDVGADLGMSDDNAFQFRVRLTRRLVKLMHRVLDPATKAGASSHEPRARPRRRPEHSPTPLPAPAPPSPAPARRSPAPPRAPASPSPR
jgi:DNA-directed RNA polymerase specialized sigma24 family protein